MSIILFYQKKTYTKKTYTKKTKFNLNNIIDYLKKMGISKSDILIVHSSFSPFKGKDITPQDIINSLINFMANEGTIVMPAIRRYKGEPEGIRKLFDSVEDIIHEYDPKRTPIWTGIYQKHLLGWTVLVQA